MGIVTDLAGPQWTSLRPPEEITDGMFNRGRQIARTHPLATDTLLAAVLLALSTVWLAGTGFAEPRGAVVQTGLVATVAVRRAWPSGVFLLACAIAFAQWLLDFPVIGDGALLICLYTVAAHESWIRAGLAAVLLEAGVFMASLKWDPAGTTPRSLLFLTATVVAALFAGLAAASGSRYLAWMDERARRLAIERDQQATIAAAAERTRIARELHDIVAHSLSVVITLADAATVVSRSDPSRPSSVTSAMAEVSEAGRQALSDMRAMLGVLRTDEQAVGLAPQPDVTQLDGLIERVRATGLAVELDVEGTPFPLGAAGGLTVYRIVQEALTNTIRHAGARQARVVIHYDAPRVQVRVTDDGGGASGGGEQGQGSGLGSGLGRGIEGMRERAALHDGTVSSGPAPDGGWLVEATLRPRPGSGTATVSASEDGNGNGNGNGNGGHVSISVLLADDQPLLRRGFRMIIEAEGDLTVTAEAADGAEAAAFALRTSPDVVLMDIRMPGTDGIEATRRIIAANPAVRVLVLTTFDLDEYAFGALRAGASGFLLKDVRPAELVAAIRTVAAGDAVVSPRVTRRLLEEYAQVMPLAAARPERYPQLSALTGRESEVLEAVARGLSNAEIAAALCVSETTVKSHVGRILAKLGLRDRVQIVVLAYEAGLVRPGMLG